jgi:hypothetical protein
MAHALITGYTCGEIANPERAKLINRAFEQVVCSGEVDDSMARKPERTREEWLECVLANPDLTLDESVRNPLEYLWMPVATAIYLASRDIGTSPDACRIPSQPNLQ